MSDYLTITSSESSTTFSGKGDSGEVDISLDNSQDEIQELLVQQESTGTYSLEYLNPIIKAVGSSVDVVTCEYSTAKPLRVEFKVSNLGQIHFYLAPRVEELKNFKTICSSESDLKLVVKFGGTSLATVKEIKNVVKTIDKISKKNKIVVVCSAVDDITDELIQISSHGRKRK